MHTINNDNVLLENIDHMFSFWSNNTIETNNILQLLCNDLYSKDNSNIIKITIIKNNLEMDISNIKFHESPRWEKRAIAIFTLIETSIKKYENKIIVDFMEIFIYIGDKCIDKEIQINENYNNDKLYLPILCFAKPINSPGILIPDWTFINAYKGKIIGNWDIQKNDICGSHKKMNDKINIVYFKGNNTSKKASNVRYQLSKCTNKMNNKMNTNNIIINLDETITESTTEWNKYKYLLDLPGAHPWSVRFKELMCLNSLCIKLELSDVTKKEMSDKKYDDNDKWINFYSHLFVPNEDYIEIKYQYKRSISNKDYVRLCDKITNVKNYFDKKKNHEKYMNMVKSANNKCELLSMDNIYEYVIYTLIYYSSIINGKITFL
jgi:hypothetical protein